MFRIALQAELAAARSSVTADDVTDLVAYLVDEIDRLGFEASISAKGIYPVLEILIEFDMDAPDPLDALATGMGTLRSALHGAQIATPGWELLLNRPLSPQVEPVPA